MLTKGSTLLPTGLPAQALRAAACVLALLGGFWLFACCPLPEALCLSLLAGDFSPLLVGRDSWFFALWCLSVLLCVGIGFLALDAVVGTLARRDGSSA